MGKVKVVSQVKCFKGQEQCELEYKINKFAEDHKIIQISYSAIKGYHYCMVLYEEV